MSEEKKYELMIKELREGLFLFDESGESTAFLLVGEKKACLIDTMIGVHDYHEAARKFTDKPIIVVNTHGHPDHIYGNVFFEKAYMHPADLSEAQFHMNDPEFVEECRKSGRTMPPFEEIKEGDVIDLGGRTLKIYDLPGHTPGGILLLCPEERILFTGDSINHHLWMQLPTSGLLAEFAKALDRVMFLEQEADMILHGHAHDFDDISLMSAMRKGIQEILEGQTSQDQPYPWFGGIATQHPFKVDTTRHFQQDDHVICYKEQSGN